MYVEDLPIKDHRTDGNPKVLGHFTGHVSPGEDMETVRAIGGVARCVSEEAASSFSLHFVKADFNAYGGIFCLFVE